MKLRKWHIIVLDLTEYFASCVIRKILKKCRLRLFNFEEYWFLNIALF